MQIDRNSNNATKKNQFNKSLNTFDQAILNNIVFKGIFRG